MNSTLRRRLAALGTTLAASAALLAATGAPAQAAATTAADHHARAGVSVHLGLPLLAARRGWYRYDDYYSYRECERAGDRGERRGDWDDYRCERDRGGWDRGGWDRGGWDRRGGGGRHGGWGHHGGHDGDYTLWVRGSWRR